MLCYVNIVTVPLIRWLQETVSARIFVVFIGAIHIFFFALHAQMLLTLYQIY